MKFDKNLSICAKTWRPISCAHKFGVCKIPGRLNPRDKRRKWTVSSVSAPKLTLQCEIDRQRSLFTATYRFSLLFTFCFYSSFYTCVQPGQHVVWWTRALRMRQVGSSNRTSSFFLKFCSESFKNFDLWCPCWEPCSVLIFFFSWLRSFVASVFWENTLWKLATLQR